MSAPTSATARSQTQLSQIVAIVNGMKTRTTKALTSVYHQIQKPQPFSGISRTYRSRDDEGEQLPPESTPVQVRVADLVEDVALAVSRMLDVVAIQDWANTRARADLVVDGQLLLADVPVTYLMWLEKQVIDLRTFVSKLPVLDVAEEWHWDEDAHAYATEPAETTRTKKIPRNHVKAPATDRHPAQVEIYPEDVVVGYWRTMKFSGAIPARKVFEMSERIEFLLDGIRFAREQANFTEVENIDAGAPLVDYLFSPALRP